LSPAGEPIVTPTRQLLPALSDRRLAMLKVTGDADEKHSHLLMRWWAGEGAAQVLASDGAILQERATGSRSLVTLAKEGLDAKATRIICEVACQLHTPRGAPPRSGAADYLVRTLAPTAQAQGGLLVQAVTAVADLLAAQREIVPLHTDLHPENILDF
jgi:streptomycin 6-kinase